jgi:lipid-A-disaccharide synthase
VRLALTANGPGEFAGWLRPLLAELYGRDPSLDARIFCVPDDYATGHEAAYARALFPQARVFEPGEYVRFALGRAEAGDPADRVQYLGGDLLHASRVRARLGGELSTYKFARRRDEPALVFAVDAKNRDALIASGLPAERIVVAGNLALDGAIGEAEGRYGDPDDDGAAGGIIIFPGSRRNEVRHLYGFFIAVALGLRKRLPGLRIAFARSRFIDDRDLTRAIESGGDARVYGERGRLIAAGGRSWIEAKGERFALAEAPMRAARHARLAIAIPGTKLTELAALGVPSVVTTLFNAPELAVINGPLQYVDRIPGVGVPLKRAAVLQFTKRFTYFAQPNIDAGRELLPELRGTLFPWRVAAVAAERFADAQWCAATGAAVRALYDGAAGAAERMAERLLRPA